MLTHLQIKNFKGWRDTGDIRMSPITLFFGANSSGKSSIGQFLMMLKQTIEYPDRKAVFYSGSRDSAVEFGSYTDMVYHHKKDNNIKFEYSWSMPEDLTLTDSLSESTYVGDCINFLAEIGLLNADSQTPNVSSFNYDLLHDEEAVLSIRMERLKQKSEYVIDAKQYSLKRNTGRPWNIGAPVRFYGFPDSVVAYYQNAEFVQEINLCHENLFKSVYYLGPLRTKPERLYIWTGNEPESVGYSGENTVAAILAARERLINLGHHQHYKSFEVIIAEKLKEMCLIDKFEVESISESSQAYAVKVKTRGSSDWVGLSDVGFGISQVLPVLVECFYAPANSIIIIEQPELHLHPSAQAALADVMIDIINSREDGNNRNIQLIIETHSEYFLNRLQRNIAEEKISKNQVSAYFADVTRSPTQLVPLEIDEYGDICNWPDDFFGDSFGETAARAKVAIRRRLKDYSEKNNAKE